MTLRLRSKKKKTINDTLKSVKRALNCFFQIALFIILQ